MTRIIISNSPDSLYDALKGQVLSATVEAEYGDRVVEGSVCTLAHHGSRSNNPAPCVADVQKMTLDVIGVSHLDLDTLGGIAALLGRKPEHDAFWNCAAWVDVNGPHRLTDCPDFNEEVGLMMDAFWAFSGANRVFPPRDGSIQDISNVVADYLGMLHLILSMDEKQIENGRKFRAGRKNDEAEMLLEEVDNVRVFVGPKFANAFYRMTDGSVAKGVVAFNTRFGSITVSLEDGGAVANAREIVQALWGDQAGGHAGIAGSPRGMKMSLNDLVDARNALIDALSR